MTTPSQSFGAELRIWLALLLVNVVVLAAGYCMLMALRWRQFHRKRGRSHHPGSARRRSKVDPWSEAARRLHVSPPEQDESGPNNEPRA